MAKARQPNKAEREHHARLRELGCIICGDDPGIHHCETGAGGRKDHMKVLPLCYYHHQGEQGIHTLSRRVWQPIYGTEQELMEKANAQLGII